MLLEGGEKWRHFDAQTLRVMLCREIQGASLSRIRGCGTSSTVEAFSVRWGAVDYRRFIGRRGYDGDDRCDDGDRNAGNGEGVVGSGRGGTGPGVNDV